MKTHVAVWIGVGVMVGVGVIDGVAVAIGSRSKVLLIDLVPKYRRSDIMMKEPMKATTNAFDGRGMVSIHAAMIEEIIAVSIPATQLGYMVLSSFVQRGRLG